MFIKHKNFANKTLMRSNKFQCRAIRRYFLIFTAIALLPLALVYLVTTEQFYRFKGYEFENDTKLQTLPDDAIRTLSQNEMDLVEERMKKDVNI